jgi:methylated-DNA-[protein]-cysteine S-methyltransferase
MTPKTEFETALDRVMAPPSAAATARAQAGLRGRLRAAQPPAVWYDFVARTPVGPLWLAVSEAGLASIHYGQESEQWLAGLRRRGFGRMERSAERTAGWRARVLGYLSGQTRTLPARVDWRGVSDFQRRVLEAAYQVPRGQVTTYNAVARELGRPRAARAVGQALRHNPLPIVLPCHRVIASDGGLRGYAGKTDTTTKAWLLRLEGAWQRA